MATQHTDVSAYVKKRGKPTLFVVGEYFPAKKMATPFNSIKAGEVVIIETKETNTKVLVRLDVDMEIIDMLDASPDIIGEIINVQGLGDKIFCVGNKIKFPKSTVISVSLD